MGKDISILHVSDLHLQLGAKKYNYDVVIRALLRDISENFSNFNKPDLIVFSGDFVRAGDDAGVFDVCFDEVIVRLADVTGTSGARIITCPGNHDLHRSFLRKHPDLSKSWISSADRNAVNEAWLSERLHLPVQEKFENYYSFEAAISTDAVYSFSDPLVKVRVFAELGIEVISINTAWASAGGLKEFCETDCRALKFPEAAIETALSHCKSEFRILVMHHPISWFHEDNERDFLRTIDGRVNVILFGHVHDAMPTAMSLSKGTTLFNQSGALFVDRERYNGYSMININTTEIHNMTRLRTYFDDRREFGPAEQIIKMGTKFSSSESYTYWQSRHSLANRELLVRWIQDEYCPYIEKIANEGISDRPVREIFVEPPMLRHVDIIEAHSESEISERVEHPITMSEIVKSGNYIISGDSECGKTTILRQSASDIARICANGHDTIVLAVVINFLDIRIGANAIIRAINANLPSQTEGVNLRAMLELGWITLLIDDVNFQNDQIVKVIGQFISDYPKNRFIFSTSSSRSIDLSNAMPTVSDEVSAAVSFQKVTVKPLTRHLVRKFVNKWSPNNNQAALLRRVVREFAAMNLPVTAANGTILLSIYESQKAQSPINRAALIERFLEYVLEKRQISEVSRGAFDFKLRMHVLAYIAADFARTERYVVSRIALRSIVERFLDTIGLQHDAEEVIRGFVSARILWERADGELSFRYRAFLEYCIAWEMSQNRDFMNWVLDDGRYLSYPNEIEYYSGIVRTDSALVDLIGARYSVLTDEFERLVEWSYDLERLPLIPLPKDSTVEALDEIYRNMMDAPPLTDAEKDEVLEADLPVDAENRQEVFRPTLSNVGQKWLTALYIYSGVVKNSEVIADGDKRKHLSIVLAGWGRLLMTFVSYIPSLVKHKVYRANGVEYRVDIPRSWGPTKAARMLQLEGIRATSKLILSHIGTEKLERQLSAPVLDEHAEPLITRYFRETLIVDLRIGDWISAVKRMIEATKRSEYLTEALILNIRDLCFLDDLSDDQVEKLRVLAGEAVVSHQRGSKREKGDAKNRVIEGLRRRMLVRKMESVKLARLKDGN